MTGKKTPKRKPTDWESIEPLYRKGTLSNYQICRQYEADHTHSQAWKTTVSEKAIRNQAKAKGWKKDLADKVQKQVRENLVHSQVRDLDKANLSDHEIVDAAAEVGTQIVVKHRKAIKALLELEEKFLIELGADPKRLHFASFQGAIFSKECVLTISEKAKTLKDLAEVMTKRIALERQAYNIIDGADPDANKVADREWTIRTVSCPK